MPCSVTRFSYRRSRPPAVMEDEKEAVQSVAEKQIEEVSRGASRLGLPNVLTR